MSLREFPGTAFGRLWTARSEQILVIGDCPQPVGVQASDTNSPNWTLDLLAESYTCGGFGHCTGLARQVPDGGA
jgi:hypothetical protein